MKLEFTQPISGMCPVQAEGTINGHAFYFRSRGGSWYLGVAKDQKYADFFDCPQDDRWYLREDYNGKLAYRDAEIGDGYKFAAGWAEEGECMEFIQRAAKRFTEEHK